MYLSNLFLFCSSDSSILLNHLLTVSVIQYYILNPIVYWAKLNIKDIQLELNKRKPGQSDVTTQRKEDDAVEILSGVFEGKTLGTPIGMIIYNKDQKSKDYSN